MGKKTYVIVAKGKLKYKLYMSDIKKIHKMNKRITPKVPDF